MDSVCAADAVGDLLHAFAARGDLAHLALLLWALAASSAFVAVLRMLSAATRRFDDFVRELALFNKRAEGHD